MGGNKPFNMTTTNTPTNHQDGASIKTHLTLTAVIFGVAGAIWLYSLYIQTGGGRLHEVLALIFQMFSVSIGLCGILGVIQGLSNSYR